MNNISRIGKVAHLSHSLRERLNLLLLDHEPAKSILPWLNSLPEVKAILAADSDRRPISKQNLSDWKQGGHPRLAPPIPRRPFPPIHPFRHSLLLVLVLHPIRAFQPTHDFRTSPAA